ncbi:hypothetical protein FN976_12050 [Caenimonas sedimenti]|uniref:EF-hand domain-containing protein n=1 Tax=Caenimonas sedimenti TaxID=2596921 RepID=A0A562ZRV5_9BURK|nr:hypothetical protein [Caenimonas sedimenti]TWO71048.1 hypothetical protein FN976_12050 [Caenimonas sedimenti]
MKSTLIFAAAVLACGASFAQSTPAVQAESNATGKAERAADAKVANRKGSTTATMGNNAMDTNGDGMISRKEWNAHHGKMWSGMKADSNGMVPWSEVEAGMGRGTPK